MYRAKKNNAMKFLAFCGLYLMLLGLVIVLPISAQQQGAQQQAPQRQDGDMARGLPKPTDTAVYIQDGGYAILEDKTFAATQSGAVQSAVVAKNMATLTLIRPKISKTGIHPGHGNYDGQGVEATGHSMIYIIDGEITTDERGANALWATEGSTIYMRGGSITSKQSHAVDPTNRGTVILYDVKAHTERGPCLANDAGDGNVIATRVTAHLEQGVGFYAIGTQTQFLLKECDLQVENGNAGSISIAANVSVTDSILKGKGGVKIADGIFNMTGGSLMATDGDAINMEGSPTFFAEADTLNILTMDGNIAMPPLGRCDILLRGEIKVSASTGNLIKVKEGTGTLALTSGVDISGNVIVEGGTLTVKLHKSTLKGTIQGAALAIADSNSKWNVTGDSVLTSLYIREGISGDTIPGIIGNGHTVTYDRNLVENMCLGGRTYNLAKGGKLIPQEMPGF